MDSAVAAVIARTGLQGTRVSLIVFLDWLIENGFPQSRSVRIRRILNDAGHLPSEVGGGTSAVDSICYWDCPSLPAV